MEHHRRQGQWQIAAAPGLSGTLHMEGNNMVRELPMAHPPPVESCWSRLLSTTGQAAEQLAATYLQ